MSFVPLRLEKTVNCHPQLSILEHISLQSRIVLLVDLDYFFAQAEETRNTSIKDKPVVVCVYSGRSEDSGAVSTANYIARKLGVNSGMSISLAKRRLQNVDAVFLPVDDDFYGEISKRIMSILRGFADRFEQVGIDEAYLDVSQRTKGSYEEAAQLGRRMKNEILIQQGLTCSIGIGPNKILAKIAADIHKPDGLTAVRPEQVTEFLSPLPVDRLMGVGVKTGEKMRALGITTIGSLAKRDVQQLIEVFGKKLGLYFHNTSSGIDEEQVQEKTEVESISRISTLKENTRALRSILEKTDKQCEEVQAELKQSSLTFKTVTTVAVMKDLSIRSRSRTLENKTDKVEVLKETARGLFENLLDESRLEVRRVGVKVSGLAKDEKSQKQLTSFIGKD